MASGYYIGEHTFIDISIFTETCIEQDGVRESKGIQGDLKLLFLDFITLMIEQFRVFLEENLIRSQLWISSKWQNRRSQASVFTKESPSSNSKQIKYLCENSKTWK